MYIVYYYIPEKSGKCYRYIKIFLYDEVNHIVYGTFVTNLVSLFQCPGKP